METSFTDKRPAQFRSLGTVLYGAGLRMQKAMAECVGGGGPDQVLILEHNPVLTLGRGASKADIHVTEEFLASQGAELHHTDRGGQVTYHGPGQIVAYPICSLRSGRRSVGRFVHCLEQAMICTAGDFGVAAERLEGYPGVWVRTARGPEKIGALGIHLKRWVSTHGIAFNLNPDLNHFRWITPCGISSHGVCSLGSLLGVDCPTWGDAEAALARNLAECLALDCLATEPPRRSILATVWRQGAKGMEILMMLRSPAEGRWWSSVTGMVETDEGTEAAAKREVFEETGLLCKPIPLGLEHTFCIDPVISGTLRGEPVFCTETCFGAEVPAEAPVRLDSGEHTEYRWCSPEEAKSLTPWEGAREALKRLIAKQTQK